MLLPLIRRLRVLLVAVVWIAAGPAHAGEADALIDRALQAHGGREALSAIVAFRFEGDIVRSARGITGTFSRQVERDGALATVMSYPGFVEKRLLFDGRGWRAEGPGAPSEVSGPLLDAMELQRVRLLLPMILDQHRDVARVVHPRVIDGVAYPAVELPLTASSTLTTWLDPASGRVYATEGIMRLGGQQMSFAALYDDYREVDGVQVAHLEQTFAQGVPTATLVVRQVVWNPKDKVGADSH